jgi:threonine/homoserine/homoserine lactone efflux protein
MYASQFLIVLTTHLMGLISPGPTITMIIRNSFTYTKKENLLTAVGLASATLTHTLLAVLGISAILYKSLIIFNVLKFAGAFYIIYLGYITLTKEKKIDNLSDNVIEKPKSTFNFIRMGFFVNLLNPYTPLFMFTIFTQVISGETSTLVKLLFCGQIALTSFTYFCLVSLLLTNNFVQTKMTLVQNYIRILSGVVLFGMGIALFFAHL